MIGQLEVSDREIADAVAAVDCEMLELLARLVEAATTLGNEEPGQVIIADAFRGLLGLEHFDLAIDVAAPRSHPQVASFSWDVSEKKNVVADCPVDGSGSVEYRWPGVAWEHSFRHVRDGSRTIRLPESTAA